MESKKREKKEVLGFPITNQAVPNRAHTEMKAEQEGKGVQSNKNTAKT